MSQNKMSSARSLSLGLSLLLGACVSPPVESPQTAVEQQTDVSTSQNVKDKVDILFMVDDSGSMAPKQDLLKQRFPDFIKQLDSFAAAGHPADYHIGVVTSSLGATGFPSCPNLHGNLVQRGQANTNVAGCMGPMGANYLEYDQKDHTQDNIPSGQTAADTFSCMATVVDPTCDPPNYCGCGFESQIESVYVALHDKPAANTGFLRDDAILAVIWITDEDDCSADASSDLFTNASLGPFNSYLCAQWGIQCMGTHLPDQPSPGLTNCAPATYEQSMHRETDLQKYVTFFTQSSANGGVKADPHDVILAAITGPAGNDATGTTVSSFSATGSANCGYVSAAEEGTPDNGPCTNIQHTCFLPTDNTFYADPSQRLSYVVAKAQNSQNTTICQADYGAALAAVGQKIVTALQPSCLTSPLKLVTVNGSMRPDCVVEDVTVATDGTTTRVALPYCPDVAGTFPCWETNENTQCAPVCDPIQMKYVNTGVDVNRNGQAAPPGTTADVSCNTIAIANQNPDEACGGAPPVTDGGTTPADM